MVATPYVSCGSCRVMMSCVAQYDYVSCDDVLGDAIRVSCGFSTTFHISLVLALCVVTVVQDAVW